MPRTNPLPQILRQAEIDASPGGYAYFAKSHERHKIGWSKYAPGRIRGLNRNQPAYRVDLIWYVAVAGDWQEKKLKAFYADYLANGDEWFEFPDHMIPSIRQSYVDVCTDGILYSYSTNGHKVAQSVSEKSALVWL